MYTFLQKRHIQTLFILTQKRIKLQFIDAIGKMTSFSC